MYSFPKYCFELPDKMHATSLSLLTLMSFPSSLFIVGNVLISVSLLQPLLGLIALTSESTSFSGLFN